MFRRRSKVQRDAQTARQLGRFRQSDEDIMVEMVAAWLSLLRAFALLGRAEGATGNGTTAARVALDNGIPWDDALKYGRAILLHTVKKAQPGRLPPEVIETIESIFDQLASKYGRDFLREVFAKTLEKVKEEEKVEHQQKVSRDQVVIETRERAQEEEQAESQHEAVRGQVVAPTQADFSLRREETIRMDEAGDWRVFITLENENHGTVDSLVETLLVRSWTDDIRGKSIWGQWYREQHPGAIWYC